MRPVRGLERPVVQWAFVALAIALIALTASLAVAVRRVNGTVGDLRASLLEERTTRDQLEARLAREQSTREALRLELERVRAGHSGSVSGSGVPTLTLQPLRKRESTPPPPTMSAPPPSQTIELRLVLPPTASDRPAPFSFVLRDWATGDERLTRGGLAAVAIEGGKVVAALVAGDVFRPGAYEVILRGKEGETATYEITIK